MHSVYPSYYLKLTQECQLIEVYPVNYEVHSLKLLFYQDLLRQPCIWNFNDYLVWFTAKLRINLHNGINSPAVSFPHWSETRLSTNIPNFNSYIAFSDFSHIEADSRNHIFTELTRLLIDKSKLRTIINKDILLTAITFTKVVFPEYCKPTSVNSISSFQKRLLNQSNNLFIRANILIFVQKGRETQIGYLLEIL